MFSPGPTSNNVEITKPTHLPIILLHKKFFLVQPSSRELRAGRVAPSEAERLALVRNSFERSFWSLIWHCYKKDFKPLLQTD